MSSIIFRNVGPALPQDLPKAKAVLAEIAALKEQILPLDQTDLDADRKRGTLGIYAKPIPGLGIVMADMKVDAYDPAKPVESMQVSTSTNPGSCEGTFIVDESTKWFQSFVDRDDAGRPETVITHKHDRATKLYQSVYVDVETGQIGYREELR